MAGTGHQALRYGAIASGVAALLVVSIVFLFPWNTLRTPLASYLSHRMHRTVTIGGDLHVAIGWTTHISANDVTVSNAAWSDLQPMARVRSATLAFGIGSLLRATPDTVQLSALNLVLEKNAAGEPNWEFGDRGLGEVSVDSGIVRYRDPTVDGDITLTLQSGAPPEAQALRFDGKGTLRGDAFTLAGHGDGLSSLRNKDDPYPLAFDLKSGRTEIVFDGTVVPASPWDATGALRIRGPDLSKLYPIVTARLPWTPPYDLAGQVTHIKRQWHFQGIKGTVGSSDLAGDLEIDPTRPRPLTAADLSSRKLVYHDLGGFVGARRGDSNRETRATSPQSGTQTRNATGRVLPNRPFKLTQLRGHDIDVKFRGRDVRWGRFAFDHVVTHITLNDGVMRFDPLDFAIADGHVTADVTLDVAKREPVARGQIEAQRVELKRIFPTLASPRGSAGRFGGRARFTTVGYSVADMFAAMDGDAAIAMNGGEASTLQLVLTNLDLARAATLLIGGDRTAEVRCAVAAMHSTRGLLTPDLMVIDTSAELIRGEGSINFRDETYDLRLDASSKKPSLLALRGPLVIGGTFRSPVVHPAAAPVVARIGAAVGLGVLAPPLALLALIDPGGTPDANCRGLYQDARIASSTRAPIRPPTKLSNDTRGSNVAERSR